jgi:N-carbamoylputrescine amidase
MKAEAEAVSQGNGTMPGEGMTVRLAAIQMESKNGLVEANLEHATQLVQKAARRGASLILLPELMPSGYVYATSIWDGAEPTQGSTVRWLEDTATKLGAWLGTSFLEADGQHFFNTFVLAAPDGKVAGRVRKQTPAVFEAFFTKGAVGSHVIETELGKIGIGICYENQLTYIPQMMCQASADLLLMPHSAPTVMRALLGHKGVKGYENSLKELATRYARQLGIPVVMANKCGPWVSPLPGLPFRREISSFPGLSAIVDSDGALKAQLADEEGVIVEDVRLDPSRKTNRASQPYGRWAWDDAYGLPWLLRNSCPVIEALGRLWYTASAERRRRARKISSAG